MTLGSFEVLSITLRDKLLCNLSEFIPPHHKVLVTLCVLFQNSWMNDTVIYPL
jgi:hypothetical protein